MLVPSDKNDYEMPYILVPEMHIIIGNNLLLNAISFL